MKEPRMDKESVDLFEDFANLPQSVQDVFEEFSTDELTYDNCQALLNALEPLGYTFEYGLDGVPYDLRRIA
jgi:hypothetical protein